MTSEAIVSVVLTTHNRSDLLPRAVRSVLSQTFGDFELIIVDDCSKDQTPEIVETFGDERIKYVRHKENRGLSAARNTGIRHASSEYIAFLDDDDEWLPTKLEKQVHLIQSLPESVGMVYCWMDYYDGDKVVTERHPELRGSIFEQVLVSQPLGNGSTWLVRKSVIEALGGFDESLLRGIDGDFVRLVCRGYEVDFVSEVLVKVHIGHGKNRITQDDKKGLENRIVAKLNRLSKFSDDLRHFPAEYALTFSDLALLYFITGDYGQAIRYSGKSLIISPFSTGIYRNMFIGLRHLLREVFNAD